MHKFLGGICALLLMAPRLLAQGWQDPAQKGAQELNEATGQRLAVHFEERTRWEEKYGVSFGKAVNQQDMLSRLRIGMQYQPVSWFTISGMGQDARAPFYGANAPSTLRDTMDLQEGWVTFGSDHEPFSFSAGRRMLNYGETRVIGTPQWTNTSRTYDNARLRYTTKRLGLEALMVSPVIVQPNSFNTPELGNRIWGTYDVLPNLWRGASIDAYALRHSENVIGGWTAPGTLGTNTYGARFYGPLPHQFSYSLEGIGQNGHLGVPSQHAWAWFAGATRPVTIFGRALSLSAEYKGASGSRYGSDHSATYDQLSPANHDKFGHEDLFGWRNLKTFKSLETLNVTRAFAWNVMYTDERLFSATDALYNSSGSKIAISTSGKAGTDVGQEVDSFVTYKAGPHIFYAGFGHFFKGGFIDATTPGINPRYFYIAQEYIIK
jgi:hypothetical protein